MSAELYPGVSFPAGLNLAVFIILSFALDMGGLGLAQIARTAREQGNEEGAKQGEMLAQWLIGIMIAGLVTVSLEQAARIVLLFVPSWKNGIAIAQIAVEIILSVARVICAVNYGHVVYALQKDYGASTLTMKDARELHEQVEAAQQQASSLRQELSSTKLRLSSEQQQVSNLRVQVETEQRTVSSLQQELSTVQAKVSRWEVHNERCPVNLSSYEKESKRCPVSNNHWTVWVSS
jgi:hypothetical protein